MRTTGRRDCFAAAFQAYERALRQHVERKQSAAAGMAAQMIPTARSRMWLRRIVMRAVFSNALLPLTCRDMGGESVLRGFMS